MFFNPRPRLEVLPIAGGQDCFVLDDALLEPDALVEQAAAQRSKFAPAARNAYPGLELMMPDAFSRELEDVFNRHVRGALGARRVVRMYSRLSLVTLPPARLSPAQSICHRDALSASPLHLVAASVLYLFRDPALGGTSFFVPRRGEQQTRQLVQEAGTLPPEEFERRHGIPRGYMLESGDWFERVLTVPARWNRLVFYDGGVFHSGDIRAPERLTDDPRSGRLSLNGFFTCTRRAA